ncbi:hypothetical protein MGG_03298 [Pyricularia oryzae 70-15]|uniref:Major facilitator superfamily (MFS) profile domain-containing protein n=4 Tax=Pyricularia oryzae TaxID=318829 RepID=G4N9F3_PYRO7|nr:uncharacterized protein MGG_03298 [Pyricularia oryzae 70-15]ELQ34578.1 hypothetical protein OOU_Y34scaffold00765g124 [Pyricularia oryzae Y34]KAI6475787.1 hypothetical protein MCOR17_001406 [Pyricularia oryzae]EHA50345.1 hypothetical protein MGG_03298 [Pyricularia oryzae 70-15]KAI6573684.1 hypothetical protein MCOR04_007347 [Pyricularia oryzae]KAI7926763.1 hypothetical protein M0657_003593 [Pyricularia oryzae]
MSDLEKEKPQGIEAEQAASIESPTTTRPRPEDFNFTPEEQKKIKRRMDLRIVTTLGFMYCVSLMDRTNLGAASIAGMDRELRLDVGDRYSIITLVFFITYTLFQPPSTVIVRAVGPRVHLALITLLWGAVMIGMGFAPDWGAMAGLRVLLGILEAGFFPSCVYLLSTWYTRYEVGRRYSVFYLIGCVASAFSGILAFGLMQMAGLGNLNGWRWIFIIEGIITCLLGISGYWLLVNFPDSTRSNWSFLGERERAWIVAKIDADRGDVKTQPFSWKKWLGGGADIKIWMYAFIFFNSTTITYSLAYFMPIILNLSLGFDVGTSQCLVAPPYVFAGIIMFTGAALGDKYHVRGPIIVFNMLLCVIGLPILGFHTDAKVRYFGIFLCTAGANANIPAVMSYQANNIRGQWKRAFCSATLVAMGGIGGIAGSLVFRNQDKPGYRPGLYACITCAICNILCVGILTLLFKRENDKADKEGKQLECSAGDDFQPGFRYTY